MIESHTQAKRFKPCTTDCFYSTYLSMLKHVPKLCLPVISLTVCLSSNSTLLLKCVSSLTNVENHLDRFVHLQSRKLKNSIRRAFEFKNVVFLKVIYCRLINEPCYTQLLLYNAVLSGQ